MGFLHRKTVFFFFFIITWTDSYNRLLASAYIHAQEWKSNFPLKKKEKNIESITIISQLNSIAYSKSLFEMYYSQLHELIKSKTYLVGHENIWCSDSHFDILITYMIFITSSGNASRLCGFSYKPLILAISQWVG